MQTNLTFDDTSLLISYSNNWAQQTTSDPQLGSFFDMSYHSAQANGASANFTFNGTSVYIYGSKGPGHSNYSVQFDNFIIFLSASASQSQFQQSLFSYTFNDSGPHFVSLTSRYAGDDQWLDLDYVTVTVNDTTEGLVPPSDPPSQTVAQSVPPPWLSSPPPPSSTSPVVFSTSRSNPQNTPKAVQETSVTSSISKVTFVLSILFGSLIIITFLAAIAFYFLRRRKPPNEQKIEEKIVYVPAPSNSPLPSPALVPPEIYTSRSPTEAGQRDPFARDPIHIHDAMERDKPRPRSPWSALSQGATTILSPRSSSPQSTGTHARLLHSKGHMRKQSHTHANHIHTQVALPYQHHTQSSQQTLVPPSFQTPMETLYENTVPVQQPLEIPIPPPPPPQRPKRPRENLLDWLGSGMFNERTVRTPNFRDDGNSARTDFLKM